MIDDVSMDFEGFIHPLENLFFKDLVIFDAKAFVDITWNALVEATIFVDVWCWYEQRSNKFCCMNGIEVEVEM